MAQIWAALITAGIPGAVTLLTYYLTNRTQKRQAAKQSILQMIMEDKVSWIIDNDFPTNYGRICDEYSVYCKNGGNGETAKKVEEYKKWYIKTEDSVAEIREQIKSQNKQTQADTAKSKSTAKKSTSRKTNTQQAMR